MSARPKKRRGKIKIKQRAIIQKKDNTNVVRPDTTRYPRMKAQRPRDNGAVFKVKIKRKGG